MSLMVFCKLVQAYADHAVYDYGVQPDDLSGRITIFSDNRHFSIEEKHTGVSDRALARVWMKYKDSIAKNEFPERMAIQIG